MSQYPALQHLCLRLAKGCYAGGLSELCHKCVTYIEKRVKTGKTITYAYDTSKL